MAMTSLFGPTPAQIEEARRLQSRQEIAQEAEPFGVFAPLYAASRNLTRTGTQSLVSGLFPESQDPALREAQAVEQIRQKYMGQNMTDPKVLQQMAVELGPVAPMAALRLAQTAKQLMPDRSKETKPNEIGKTPQGLQVYQDGNEQFYLKDGQRIPYYGSLRQETVAPTGTKQIAAIQGIRGDYLKEVKPEFEAFSALDSAKRSLTQLSGIGDELAKRQLLKAAGESGSGLSNKDVAAFASFGPLGQRIAGTINRFLEGTYSDEQRKEIISLIDQLQGQLQSQADEKGKQYKDFASGIEGVTSKDINFITPSLSSIYRQNAVPFGTTSAPPQGATGSRELTTKTGNRARILPSQ
jgi:hypothetical protein